jgi:hypothetical protein
MNSICRFPFALGLLLLFAVDGRATTNACFAIRVVDEQSGRGVPLVELKTQNSISCWTDSAGIVAFREPGLMGEEVFFHINSPGYEYPKDFFGNRGLKLRASSGGNAEVKLKRLNIAERLYRVTGGGIYRDSLLAGLPTPLKHPVLNGQVFGQDTVTATPYRGKIFWLWGDTDRPAYPLGNFGMSGATSEFPANGGLDPSLGVDLTYFTNKDGFSRPMCPDDSFGGGLKWIEGVMPVRDEHGQERLLARVAAGTGLQSTREWRLAIFNDQKNAFESLVKWDVHDSHDSAHPFRARINGVDYCYLYPNYRIRDEWNAYRDLNNYEACTCVAGDGKLDGKQIELDRDATGHVRYSWKSGADRLHPGRLGELIRSGKLDRGESWLQLADIETGAPVDAGRGSVFWNDYHQRWIMIISGRPGEVWFSEADFPTGPWVYARRVAVHGRYNFYNPTQHPFFDQEDGRVIYFEGTYTAAFSGAPAKTPRYDYNQMMYRLNLDDPRLALPQAVYRVKNENGSSRFLLREGVNSAQAWNRVEGIAFFAMLRNAPKPAAPPLFSGLPLINSTDSLNSLYELLSDQNGKPLCRVWKNPATKISADFWHQPMPLPLKQIQPTNRAALLPLLRREERAGVRGNTASNNQCGPESKALFMPRDSRPAT